MSTDNKKNSTNIPTFIGVESALGAVLFIASKSPNHKFLFINEFEWKIMPAIANKQFRLFRSEKNEPLAFISWARIDEKTEKRFLTGNIKLAPNEWNLGEKNIIMDVISEISSTSILKEFLAKQKDNKKFYIPQIKEKGVVKMIELKQFIASKSNN